ncbi:hypothetical protein L1049_001478 [Liquidambar formosana]|uniref:C2H2-type domain-containing protein n=1 Tax=Liquidambar formosana TaxID=63359 RepID=A0AAP0R5J0_LIQFO
MDEDQQNQFDVPLQDSEKTPASGSLDTSVSEDRKPPMTTNGRLWIKLKIPNSGGELSGEESVQDHYSPTPPGKNLSRICNVCNKGFSSGKALGGHMRIHVQANKDLLLKKTQNPKLKKHLTDLSSMAMARSGDCDTVNADGPMSNSKPTCSLCGKNFPSMKSLFGHMRCHPEREWRGIQPPSATAKNSSSSTLSDAVPRKTDDHIDSATTTVGSVVDLSVSLSRWSVTAKRGRKSTTSTARTGNIGSDENIPDAVYNLMMLAQGHGDSLSYKQRDDVSEATNSNSLTIKAEIEDKNRASEWVVPSKKRRIEASPVGYKRNFPTKKLKIEAQTDDIVLKKMDGGKGKALLESEFFLPEKPVIMNSDREYYLREDQMEESDSDGGIPGEELNRSYKISRKMIKKTRRKVKLRDLGTVGEVAPLVDQIHKQIPAATDRYKCSTCNRSFPTHQALGGHRSSHNKVKNIHTMDESAYAADASTAEDEHYANPTAQVLDETAECEEAASSRVVVGVAPHQCRICNKTFPTGQALGGHKRCHWTGPVEAPPSQVASPGEASQTGRRILSFDLNELPAMEDEEGIESAFTHQPEHAAGYASSSHNSVT